MKRSSIPLHWRVAGMYILLLVIAFSLLGLILAHFLNQSYLNMLQKQLFSDTYLINEQINPIIAGGPPYTPLEAEIQTSAKLISARITIILPDGTVIAETTQSPDGLENHLSRPEIQEALKGKEATASRYSSTTRIPMLYTAIPILVGNQVAGVLRLSVPQSYISQNYRLIGRLIFISCLISTLVAILFALLLTNHTTRPLRQLTTRVQAMIGENDPEALPRLGGDEVYRLSQAFDTLSSQLISQISALQNERTKLEVVLENMTDGVIMVDNHDQVVLINPAALKVFQIDLPSALYCSLVEVVRHHQVVDLWEKCKTSVKAQNNTFELTPSRVFIQAFAIPLPLIGPDYVLLVIQDLTRVQRLETVRRDFISNISHELRTPLASLKALAETLQEGALEDAPAARRFLSQMDREIDNLAQLVQELLELSRIESGKVPLVRRPIQPAELLQEAMNRMSMQADRASIHLQLNLDEELPTVQADPIRISQVLLNLLHNAIKFTPPGGKIILNARSRPFDVIFSIQDTGSGIPSQDLNRIFERFYKTDRSRSGGGTGLGLSIARHLIEAHGGRIWAESTEGSGSTFYFSLPKSN